jgi:hypothetical protein
LGNVFHNPKLNPPVLGVSLGIASGILWLGLAIA